MTQAIPQRALDIIQQAADEHMATLADVLDRVQYPHVVKARHEAWRRLHATGILSSASIARMFQYHHTSVGQVLHGKGKRSKA